MRSSASRIWMPPSLSGAVVPVQAVQEEEGGSATIEFASDWSTATGTDITTALRDGGVWTSNSGGEGRIEQCLSVVAGSGVNSWTRTTNVLRMRMRGLSLDGLLVRDTALPTPANGVNYYGRIFVNSDLATGALSNHCGCHSGAQNDTVLAFAWFACKWTAGAFDPFMRSYYSSSGAAMGHPFYLWEVPGGMGLSNNTWYRYEWRIEFLSATTFRYYPRWYNMAGTLLFDADDFKHADPSEFGGGQTLNEWYTAGNSFGVGATQDFRQMTLGQEGAQNTSDIDRSVYFAELAVASDTWIGTQATTRVPA